MLTGRNAVIYRENISGISVDELAEYIDISLIKCVEDTKILEPDNDIILSYYRAVNKVKQEKVKKSVAETASEPVKPKTTKKPRQPKNKT